jgi:hypothetical protein
MLVRRGYACLYEIHARGGHREVDDGGTLLALRSREGGLVVTEPRVASGPLSAAVDPRYMKLTWRAPHGLGRA